MKKIIALSFICCSLFSCAQDEVPTEFTNASLNEKVTDLNGKEMKFSEVLKNQKGKVTVIEFWASWCSDCIKAMPKVKAMQAANPRASKNSFFDISFSLLRCIYYSRVF